MHPPWFHVCCQPSLQPCFWPIKTILPMYQAPHTIPSWFPKLPHNLSIWPWWYHHLWPPSRGFTRWLPLSKDIQWTGFFLRSRIRMRPQLQKSHSLCHYMYFWCLYSLVWQKTTSLYSPLHRIRSLHFLLSHQNYLMAHTHLTKPWLPSLWCSNSYIWVNPTYYWYYKEKPSHKQS